MSLGFNLFDLKKRYTQTFEERTSCCSYIDSCMDMGGGATHMYATIKFYKLNVNIDNKHNIQPVILKAQCF